MSQAPRILAFAGSTREQSYNKQVVRIAAEGSRLAGAQVTSIDLRDYPLPIFDQDWEQRNGKPENAKVLKQLMIDHQGLLIASPEYNGSITALLKNTIDWVTRRDPEDTTHKVAFNGKVTALLSASASTMGGMRGLVHLRAILGNAGCIVLPGQVTVGEAHKTLVEDMPEDLRERLLDLGRTLTVMVGKLNA